MFIYRVALEIKHLKIYIIYFWIYTLRSRGSWVKDTLTVKLQQPHKPEVSPIKWVHVSAIKFTMIVLSL